MAYINLADHEKSLQAFEEAVKINPSADAVYNRGLSKYYLQRDLEAISDFNAVLKLDSNYALAYFNRGLCLMYSSKLEEACEDWKSALRKGHLPAKALLDDHCEE